MSFLLLSSRVLPVSFSSFSIFIFLSLHSNSSWTHWLLLEIIRLFLWLPLLWHQKILYLVAPFMGKQVLKRQRPDGLVTAGLPGYSIYIICSPLMLQHIEVFYVIASLNWFLQDFKIELSFLLLSSQVLPVSFSSFSIFIFPSLHSNSSWTHWLLLELIRLFLWLPLLWHQKLLYLVAPFMGKQVLKRQRPDGLVTAGLPGYSIYIICSPLMLQHIEVFYIIASFNWLLQDFKI